MTIRFADARFANTASATQRAIVAVSACLAGERVRYDGADKLLTAFDRLNSELVLIPICPEVGAGLTVPRPAVQLVQAGQNVYARGRDDHHLDVTTPLQTFAQHSLEQLSAQQTLCGYIWKSRSPSCGYDSTPLFDSGGTQIGLRSGIQAAHFQRALPWLSYCEETDLGDDVSIEYFVLRCRIVFDFLHAGTVLADLDRHYQFLTAGFPAGLRGRLRAYSERGLRTDYLTALQQQCDQIDKQDLLNVFSR